MHWYALIVPYIRYTGFLLFSLHAHSHNVQLQSQSESPWFKDDQSYPLCRVSGFPCYTGPGYRVSFHSVQALLNSSLDWSIPGSGPIYTYIPMAWCVWSALKVKSWFLAFSWAFDYSSYCISLANALMFSVHASLISSICCHLSAFVSEANLPDNCCYNVSQPQFCYFRWTAWEASQNTCSSSSRLFFVTLA